MSYSVLQTAYSQLPVPEYFEIYTDILQLNEFDAKSQLNKHPGGILIENIDFTQAKAIQERFQGKGVETVVLADRTIRKVQTKQIKKAAINEQLEFEDFYGRPILYNYSHINAVEITIEPSTSKKSPLDREFLLDIILDDSQVLRINSSRFNYSYLGNRKTSQTLQNFFLLLSDLEDYLTPITWKGEGYIKGISQQFEEIIGFEFPRQYELYIQWLGQLDLFTDKKVEEVTPIINLDSTDKNHLTDTVENEPQPQITLIKEQNSEPENVKEKPLRFDQEESEKSSEPKNAEPKEPSIFEAYQVEEIKKQIRAANKAIKKEDDPEEGEITNILLALEQENEREKLTPVSGVKILIEHGVPRNLYKEFLASYNFSPVAIVKAVKHINTYKPYPKEFKASFRCLLIVIFCFIIPVLGISANTAYWIQVLISKITLGFLTLCTLVGVTYTVIGVNRLLKEKLKGWISFSLLTLGHLFFVGVFFLSWLHFDYYREVVNIKALNNACIKHYNKTKRLPQKLDDLIKYNPEIENFFNSSADKGEGPSLEGTEAVDYYYYPFKRWKSRYDIMIRSKYAVRYLSKEYFLAITYNGELKRIPAP